MPERKGPQASATLYKVGTKKTGNDGNIWIIVENKAKIKRWQLHRKPSKSPKPSSRGKSPAKPSSREKSPAKPAKKVISVLDMYDVPKLKTDWAKWMSLLAPKQVRMIEKLRASYDDIKAHGITPVEVILPLSYGGIYWMDYPWDYAKSLYPNMNDGDDAYVLIIFKINRDLHITLEKPQNAIFCQHIHLTHAHKKNFMEFMKKFNAKPGSKVEWNGSQLKIIKFLP